MSKIPLNNILYMLGYAYQRFNRDFDVKKTESQKDKTEDTQVKEKLFLQAFIPLFTAETERIFRSGLHREYQTFEDKGRRITGRIDFQKTLKQFLFPQGRVACRSDELTHDNIPNRIIKSAARVLLNLGKLTDEHEATLRRVLYHLPDVKDEPLRIATIRNITVHRQIRRYRFLFLLCEILAGWFAHQETGEDQFLDLEEILKNTLANLFEEFVYGFYLTEFPRWKVESQRVFSWRGLKDNPLLPKLKSDVVITTSKRKMVIECKFKYGGSAFSEHFGRPTLISGHLNQLFAYLSNINPHGRTLSGILLYGLTDSGKIFDNISFQFVGAADVVVAGVDLTADWETVENQLRGVHKILAGVCE